MISLLLTFLAFAITIFFIVRPTKVRVPFLKKKLELDYAWGSIIGAGLLLLFSALTPGQVFDSLIGRPGFSPYTIIILFMSLAYIAISLDSTGFFEYASIRIIRRSGGDGRKLFFYFFFLSSAITMFTSNDIVILTLTPIIFYFGKHAKINIVPYLIAEFFAANIWSMFLYIGNPTNIIVALASGIQFFEFSYWMALPTLAGGLVCLAILYVLFRKDISMRFEQPDIDPSKFIPDKGTANIVLILFSAAMFSMAFAPLLGMELWVVALAFATILFAYDGATAFREYANKRLVFFRAFRRYIYHKETTLYQFRLKLIVMERMPWKVVPFLLASFIMVESLVVSGFVDMAASFMTYLSPNILASALSMGFISSLAANVLNNQPMTVLFTKILESSQFALEGSVRAASTYALIIGSNLGANITIVGSLAGIMWAKIVKDKGEETITYMRFLKIGLIVTPLVILVTCLVLAIEFMLIPI